MTTSYLLDASPDERRRLLEQGDMFRGEAERLLDRCGLRCGWRALDVGCGPLGILHLLAERVGAGGKVVGLDGDPDMISRARAAVVERGLANVDLVEGDAHGSSLPRASFDLAHTRFLLVNVPDPAAVVRKMTSLVRPGGWVALQDIDWVSRICEPAHPAWDRLVGIVSDLWHGDGMDVFVGRRLFGLLRGAGLRDLGVDATTRVFRRGEPNHTLMVTRAEQCREALLARGLIGEQELDECLAAVRAHLDDEDTLVLHGTFFQAWGRVPTDGDRPVRAHQPVPTIPDPES